MLARRVGEVAAPPRNMESKSFFLVGGSRFAFQSRQVLYKSYSVNVDISDAFDRKQTFDIGSAGQL